MTTHGDGTVGPQNRAGATKGEFMTDPSSTPKRTRRGETAAIVPSELKPGRKTPFADDEFWAELARIRAEMARVGKTTHDPEWRHRPARTKGVSE